MIGFADKPANAALEVEAPQIECALNVLVSMPAKLSTSFNQRATEQVANGS
jgi:hypothetical protein